VPVSLKFGGPSVVRPDVAILIPQRQQWRTKPAFKSFWPHIASLIPRQSGLATMLDWRMPVLSPAILCCEACGRFVVVDGIG
jgi:hypothetical protein